MFRFEHPAYLYALFAIPIVLGLYLLYWQMRRRSIQRMGVAKTVRRMMPDYSKYMSHLKMALLLVALAFLVVAWSNPQWGTKHEKVKRKSVDVMIALDISQSMMAEDVKPNRLERSKKFIHDLIDKIKGERIGLIIFAGNAYLQMPLSTDYAAAKLFVKSANTKLAATQGTAIADAIDLADRSLRSAHKNNKALVIISDGENHETDAIQAAQNAVDEGMLIFTIGVGSEQGAYIPQIVMGQRDLKRDQSGKPVRSIINEEMLSEIAITGGGAYYNLDMGKNIFKPLKERINQLEKQELEQRVFNEFESYFQIFLAIGLLLLCIEFLLSKRKISLFSEKDIFKI